MNFSQESGDVFNPDSPSMRRALCVRHQTHRVSDPPSLRGEDDIASENRRRCASHLLASILHTTSSVEAAPTTSAIRASFQAGARGVFREVTCDLEFFLGVPQQQRSLQAERSIRQILSRQ
ncbi:hypothetical protein [Bradyrhizobium sp. 25ACV]